MDMNHGFGKCGADRFGLSLDSDRVDKDAAFSGQT